MFFAAEEEDIKTNKWLGLSTIPPEKEEEEDESTAIT